MRAILIACTAVALMGGVAEAKPRKTAETATTTAPATTPAPAATSAPTATPAPTKAARAPRTAISLDCSRQADAKGLHGKDRKKFRSTCMRPAAKG